MAPLYNSGCKDIHVSSYRVSRPEVFCKKVLQKISRHLSLFFNKFAGLRLIKERFWHMYFLVNFAKFLRPPIYFEQLRWLFLVVSNQPT